MNIIQNNNETTYLGLLNDAIVSAKELLTSFAFKDELLADFSTAFGSNYSREGALELVEQWQEGEFESFPEIVILPSTTINGANGAYSVDTDKIYIAEEFLQANANNVNAIAALILEEYGHSVDTQINAIDAAGDEGAIFSGLVRGESFTGEQLQALKAENDKAVVNIDGKTVAIEQFTGTPTEGADKLRGPFLGAGNDNLRGLGGNDTFYGGNGHDTLRGDGGNDLIYGDSANDRLYGGTDNDTLWGGTGNDYLSGEDGNDSLEAGDGFDTLYGGLGRDTLWGRNNNDTLYGQGGNDLLYGDNGNDRVYGGDGDDTLYGWWGRDTLWGGNGNDVFYGQQENDTIYGESGNDRLYGQDGNDSLEAGDGFDTLWGGNGNDTLWGRNQNDTLYGENGNDLLYGDNGNDLVYGQEGNDTLYGYWGNDTLWGGNGNDVFYAQGDDDRLYGEGGNDRLYGEGGNDTIFGWTGSDTLYGGDGNDDLWGQQENDTIYGENGDDILRGHQGNDFLVGGNGNDTYFFDTDYGSGIDTIREGISINQTTNIDTLDFSETTTQSINIDLNIGNQQTINSNLSLILNSGNGINIENVIGGAKDDTLIGNQLNNLLRGGAGNDILHGGAGRDTLDGGAGNETVTFANASQGYIVRLDGANQSFANGTQNSLNDKTLSNIENIIGSNFADTLMGDNLNNRLEGNGGNDLLKGLTGDDSLTGGNGNDTLDGEFGNDWAIEQANVNFTLTADSINSNTHYLTGLGNDSLINIETVKLTGGASNNILDASLATIDVKLEGGGGSDTLKGGTGADTLVGGTGTNELWGGAGRDTFIIDRSSSSVVSGDVQIIRDFDPTTDTIDLVGADLRNITFDRTSINGTIILENGIERARVIGNTDISLSALSSQNKIYPSIAANRVGDLDYVIQQWVQNYASNLGTSLENIGNPKTPQFVSLSGVSLTQGTITYSPFTSLVLPNGDIQVTQTYINNSNSDQPGASLTYTQKQSATTDVTQSTSYSSTTTQAMEHGWSIGTSYSFGLTTSVSGEIFGLGASVETQQNFSISGETYGNYSQSGSFTDGGSTSQRNIETAGSSTSTTYTFTAPGYSVTNFRAISDLTTYSGSYEMDVSIGGTISFKLADDGNKTNGIVPIDVTVPVALILEQYNPEIFYSRDTSFQTYTLLDGTELFYSSNLGFKVTGTIETASVYNTRIDLDTIYDSFVNGTNETYDASVKANENLWVALGSLPLAGNVDVITGFQDGLDRIGFANIPQITGFGSLTLSNSGTSGFISYGTQTLVELVGIDATALTADDFIFSTAGTSIA